MTMLPRFARQRDYDSSCYVVPAGRTVFSLLLRPLTRLYAAVRVWIPAEVIRVQTQTGLRGNPRPL